MLQRRAQAQIEADVIAGLRGLGWTSTDARLAVAESAHPPAATLAFRPFVAGTYAVALPARDVLAFGDADDPNVRAELRAMNGRLPPDSDHRLLDQLFVRAAGGWEVLDV